MNRVAAWGHAQAGDGERRGLRVRRARDRGVVQRGADLHLPHCGPCSPRQCLFRSCRRSRPRDVRAHACPLTSASLLTTCSCFVPTCASQSEQAAPGQASNRSCAATCRHAQRSRTRQGSRARADAAASRQERAAAGGARQPAAGTGGVTAQQPAGNDAASDALRAAADRALVQLQQQREERVQHAQREQRPSSADQTSRAAIARRMAAALVASRRPVTRARRAAASGRGSVQPESAHAAEAASGLGQGGAAAEGGAVEQPARQAPPAAEAPRLHPAGAAADRDADAAAAGGAGTMDNLISQAGIAQQQDATAGLPAAAVPLPSTAAAEGQGTAAERATSAHEAQAAGAHQERDCR